MRNNKERCECVDPGCPCKGTCRNDAEFAAFRVDMEDEWGTLMCDRCARDAMESGLYTLRQRPE